MAASEDEQYSLPPLTENEDALLQVGPYNGKESTNPSMRPSGMPIQADYDSNVPVTFRQKHLWDDCVEVDLPSSFYDISDILHARDHQMVFADWLSPMTINIDLMESLHAHSNTTNDEMRAFQEHIKEITEEYDQQDPSVRTKDFEGLTMDHDKTGPTRFAKLGQVTPRMRNLSQYAARIIQHFHQPPDPQVSQKGIMRDNLDFVALFVGMIRYRGADPNDQSTTTDIVITVAVPHIPGIVKDFTRGPQDVEAKTFEDKMRIPLVQKGQLVLDRILQTFDVTNEALLKT